MESIRVLYYPMGLGSYHKILQYVDNFGKVSILEAGPQDKLVGLISGPITKYPPETYPSVESMREDLKNLPSETLLIGEDLMSQWQKINEGMDQITSGDTSYFLPGMNSNYAADFALLYAGLDLPALDVMDYFCPGSINFENGALNGHPKGDSGFVPISNLLDIVAMAFSFERKKINEDFLSALKVKAPGPPLLDPLALDLDGDGVETVGEGAGIFFDHNGDGDQEGQRMHIIGK